MSRLVMLFRTAWVIACGLIGLLLGATTGYANGGWIGAVLLGVAGYVTGASLATFGG